MEKDDRYYMEKAYNEAKKAYSKNEIPVGVVIVENGVIISKAHNLRDTLNIVTKHAEIVAIEKANRKLNNWRLIDSIMYCTLEPCDMCQEVINESKINKVVFAAKNNNKRLNINNDNYYQIQDQDVINKCELLIKNKFKELRTIKE